MSLFMLNMLLDGLFMAEFYKELPILRGTCQDVSSFIMTDSQHALQYHQARQWEAAASESTRFNDKGILYKYRKGAAANVSPSARTITR
jgi:hypothetical protein